MRNKPGSHPTDVEAEPKPYRLTDNPMHFFASIMRQNQTNLGRILMPLDLNPHMWRVIAYLSDGAGRTISEMADAVVIDRSNLSRLIDTMAQSGLVERISSEADRRLSVTRLTGDGKAKFAEALPLVRDMYRRLMEDIPAEEFDCLMTSLRKLKRNALSFDPS